MNCVSCLLQAFNPPWQQQQQQALGGLRPGGMAPHNFPNTPGMVPPLSHAGRMPMTGPVPMPGNLGSMSQGPPGVRPWQPPSLNNSAPSAMPTSTAPMGMGQFLCKLYQVFYYPHAHLISCVRFHIQISQRS